MTAANTSVGGEGRRDGNMRRRRARARPAHIAERAETGASARSAMPIPNSYFFFSSSFSSGAPVPDDPTNIFCPSAEHDAPAVGDVGSVLGAIAFDDDFRADRQLFLFQPRRSSWFGAPISTFHATVLPRRRVLDVDVQPRMRIDPIDARHRALAASPACSRRTPRRTHDAPATADRPTPRLPRIQSPPSIVLAWPTPLELTWGFNPHSGSVPAYFSSSAPGRYPRRSPSGCRRGFLRGRRIRRSGDRAARAPSRRTKS